MRVHNLSLDNSIAQQFLAEIRHVDTQTDRLRFRRNLERLSEILAYEISKKLAYTPLEVETPLGYATGQELTQQPVIASILRAGIPMHHGFLNYFDKADNAFISAYRRHHKDGSFEIQLEYVSTPDLNGRTVILADPMIATGSSIEMTVKALLKHGTPASIHIATIITSADGLEYLKQKLPYTNIWMFAIDEELTAKLYVVPGLGDAGDLAFGDKMKD